MQQQEKEIIRPTTTLQTERDIANGTNELPANQESKGSHPQALDISRSVMRTDKTLQGEENRNERL
jgi:hypothetical protein